MNVSTRFSPPPWLEVGVGHRALAFQEAAFGLIYEPEENFLSLFIQQQKTWTELSVEYIHRCMKLIRSLGAGCPVCINTWDLN